MTGATINQNLELARISVYLSTKMRAQSNALGGGATEAEQRIPMLLHDLIKSVEWAKQYYEQSAALEEVVNYMYSLCGQYMLKAKTIIGNHVGVIVNPDTGAVVLPTLVIHGNDLTANGYGNAAYAGLDLLIFYNGVKYLRKFVDYTIRPAGGFDLVLPGPFTSDDEFYMIPNGTI